MRFLSSRAAFQWIFLFFMIILGAFPAVAQRGTFASYGQAAGLTNLNVTAMMEDHTGVLWVATQGGVFRANGASFERERSLDSAGLAFVLAMHEDLRGRIWIVSNRGLGYLDEAGVHLVDGLGFDALYDQSVDLATVPTQPDAVYISKAGKVVRIASRDGGKRWAAEPAFPQTLLLQHPELKDVTSIGTDRDGHLWAGCSERLCQFADGLRSVRVWGERDGLASDHWQKLLFTRSGEVWARGDHGVAELSPTATHFRMLPALPPGFHLNVRLSSMAEDSSGRVMLNVSNGIARAEGSGWSMLSAKQGLPRDEIELLFISHGGLLWVAPSGHGLARWLGYGNWEGWTHAEGLSSDTVWGMARAQDGRIWIGSERGLDTLAPATGKISRAPSTADYRLVMSTAVDSRGHIWTGDALGRLTELDPRTGHARTTGGLERIWQLLVDRQRRIWVASRHGIDHLDPSDDWNVLHHVENGDVHVATEIAEGPDGTLWFSTEKGLLRLKGETWQSIKLPTASAGEKNFVLAAAPDGTLWIETGQEAPVLHLRVQGDTAFDLGRVSASIVGSSITFLDFDRRGWLWLGSETGVSVFDGQRWVHVTQEDGLLWDDTDTQGFLADPDGSVWIGTTGGLAHLRRPETLFQASAPAMRIAEAKLGAISVSADRAAGRTSVPQYNLRHPALTVELSNTAYARPSALVYRYRLAGEENEWQQTTMSQLRFPSLPAGDYSLTVIPYDTRLHLASAPHTVSFELLPPWWERLWFRVLERLAAVGLLLLVWRGSIRILVARQYELEAQVLERTRELEQEKAELLSARSNLIEMTRRDGLTGLLNRTAIFEKMAEECKAARGAAGELAIVMADLDHFKHINDTYGHVAGDTVIRRCAERIFNTIRPGDSVGRYGGEELLILMPGLSMTSAASRMEELRVAVAAEPIVHDDLALWMTCSFGVAWVSRSACDAGAAVAAADAALYRAKQKGRNRVEIDGGGAAHGARSGEDQGAADGLLEVRGRRSE